MEQILALLCAGLLGLSVFLLPGREPVGMLARVALLLFPLAGGLAWLICASARRTPLERRIAPDTALVFWMGWPMLGFFAVSALLMAVHADPLHELDKPVRFLLVALGLAVWSRLRMDAAVFRRTVLVLALGAAPLLLGVALYERVALGVGRVGQEVYPIQFADMAMGVALIALVLAVGMRPRLVRWLAALSATAAFVGVWMTASRGAFLALPVLPWLVAYARGRRVTGRLLLQVLGAAVLAVALALASSAGLRSRLAEAGTDLQSFRQGDAATSIGMRLQMWQNATQLFLSSPVWGVGEQGYLQSQRDGVAQHRLDPMILEFNAAHNQYLDALAKGGLLQGLATLLVFFMPLVWFWRRCRQPGAGANDGQVFAAAGLAVTAAYPLFAMTQHVFVHGTGVMFFAGATVLFGLASSLSPPQAAGRGI